MALTGKILVYWIGSLLWETVAYKSWLHMEVQFIPSLLQLLIPPIMQFFPNPSTNWRLLTTLLCDEKMLYETFLTLGLFRLLFCRTCDQAVLYFFFFRRLPLWHWGPEVMNSDLVFAPTFFSKHNWSCLIVEIEKCLLTKNIPASRVTWWCNKDHVTTILRRHQ